MAGMKVMTATSGPGISLYSEQISFAIGSEIPIVIVNVQRLGPSTGSATRGADGDINFMRWGNSSGLPVIVLAPVDVKDCYSLTIHAFNLAETYRCPVFLASNKEIGMTRESIDFSKVDKPMVIDRVMSTDHEHFLPFQISNGQSVPYFLPIGGSIPVRQTSSTHGVDGYITTDAEEIASFQKRLYDKLQTSVDGYSYHELENRNAPTLLITYGVSARAAKTAVRLCNQTGHPVSLLVLKTLWPVPEDLIRRTAHDTSRVIVIEMNLGQYVNEIRRILPDKTVDFFGQMDGRLITPRQIEEVITSG